MAVVEQGDRRGPHGEAPKPAQGEARPDIWRAADAGAAGDVCIRS